MTSLSFVQGEMTGHDRNMFWLVQRTQSTSMLLLSIVLLAAVELAAVSCNEKSCSRTLHRGVKLARFVNRTTAELIKTYQENQGDFAEQFCTLSIDNVPPSTLSGHTTSERVLSIYTRLTEFLPHLKKVLEQQKDLQPPFSPVPDSISRVTDHSRNLARSVSCFLQILQPNIPLPEPADRPTQIPPAQNVFQQKVYGCVVLTRLGQFLSRAVNELRSLKGNVCKKKIGMTLLK